MKHFEFSVCSSIRVIFLPSLPSPVILHWQGKPFHMALNNQLDTPLDQILVRESLELKER